MEVTTNLYLNSAITANHFHNNFENKSIFILKNNPLLSDFDQNNVLNKYNNIEAEIKTEFDNDNNDVKKWRQEENFEIMNHYNNNLAAFNLNFELLDSWTAVGFGPPSPLMNLQHHKGPNHLLI